MSALVCRFVRKRDGRLVPVAVVWEPEDAAQLARDLAAITGRPVQSLPAHLQETPR